MSGESLDETTLLSLYEAARWGAIFFQQSTMEVHLFDNRVKRMGDVLNLLMEGNHLWANNASFLTVVISRKKYEDNGKFSRTHQLDTGSAWENMAIEASSQGLAIHGMAGFDYEKAKVELGIPEDFEVMMMIAVKVKDSSDKLPEQLRARETPSSRKPTTELIMRGRFQTADK